MDLVFTRKHKLEKLLLSHESGLSQNVSLGKLAPETVETQVHHLPLGRVDFDLGSVQTHPLLYF